MILLIIGIVIAALLVVGYGVWLYFVENPKTHCSSCGTKLTIENRIPPDGNTCATCYAVDMAPEAYNHYDLHNLERI